MTVRWMWFAAWLGLLVGGLGCGRVYYVECAADAGCSAPGATGDGASLFVDGAFVPASQGPGPDDPVGAPANDAGPPVRDAVATPPDPGPITSPPDPPPITSPPDAAPPRPDIAIPVDAPPRTDAALSVSLSASVTTVLTTSPIELTVTATSTSGTIGKVELYQGTTLLGTRNAVPATFSAAFVAGDNGPHTFTARVYTATSMATSVPLTVTVAISDDPCGALASRCVAATCATMTCLAPAHLRGIGFGSWARAAGLRDSTLTGTSSFDTHTGAAGMWRAGNADPTIYQVVDGIGFVRVKQGAGEPELAVWVFKSVHFSGGTVSFAGDAAVVLASAGSFTVDAGVTLDVAAKGNSAGPGGFVGGGYGKDGSGCGPGRGGPLSSGSMSTDGGGSGGGFGTSGGGGGGVPGGQASACAAYVELQSLRGGSGGGGGDDSSSDLPFAFGGGGGGALQLSALGRLTFAGVVNAGGGGGRTSMGNWRDGAGGGSGGAIYLESPELILASTAGLYANGGGGGSSSAGTGSSCSPTPPSVAEDGKPSLDPALGSRCGSGKGGNGAAGASNATDATVGSDFAASQPTGGGGGGHGRIVLSTVPGAKPTVGTTNLSPAAASAAYRMVTSLGQ